MKKVLCAAVIMAGVCNGMSSLEDDAKKIVHDSKINDVEIDSPQMCVLEQSIAFGSPIGVINEDIMQFRKKLAELALKEIDFSKENAAMKGALICFALQSTSNFSVQLWKNYELDERLFERGRINARKNCMTIYNTVSKREEDTFIPEQIWSYMYSKGLVSTSTPDERK